MTGIRSLVEDLRAEGRIVTGTVADRRRTVKVRREWYVRQQLYQLPLWDAALLVSTFGLRFATIGLTYDRSRQS